MAAFACVLLAVALLITSSTALILWRSRVATFQQADASADSLLNAISKDLNRIINFYDISLRWAIDGVSTPGFSDATEPIRRQMLFASDLSARTLGGLLLTDDTGRSLYESGAPTPRIANVSDKPYFKALRDHPDPGLVISRPFQTVISNGMSIALARRVNGADGLFGGVVVSTLRLSLFRELFSSVAAGTGDSIALMNFDGILLAREPWDDKLIGHSLANGPLWPLLKANPTGNFDMNSPFDGSHRHYRYARVGDLPLVLLVGVATQKIYAAWWSQALAIGGVTTVSIALLLGLARALHVELRRRRRAELSAREGAAEFQMIAENVSDVIVRFDLNGVRKYVSPSVEQMLGYTPQEMLSAGTMLDFVHPEDRGMLEQAMRSLRDGTEQTAVIYRVKSKAGNEIWVESNMRRVCDAATGDSDGMIAVIRDVSLRYKSEQELRRLAATDGLTGVANRRTFDEILETEWRGAMRAAEDIGLLMLDADYFKLYNDRYGHQAGDDVLRMIADSLTTSVRRAGDLAARYGGEEFVVLLPRTGLDGSMTIAERIRETIERRAVVHEGSPLRFVSVSIGVASLRATKDSEPRSLIKHADAALYEAKRSGRNRVAKASPSMPEPVS